MPRIVIGYNVEYRKDREISARFLKAAATLHRKLDAPCTFYVIPDLAREVGKDIKALAGDPLFDFQIALHVPIKTVCQMTQGQITVWPGAAPEDTADALRRGKEVLSGLVGEEPVGVSDALGCYRGLMDRPDLLAVLNEHDISFTRTWGRDRYDWQPVEFAIEPFWYGPQGYPGILEFPAQGWQESLIRPVYGWDETEGFTEYLKSEAEEVARREDQVWSYWSRDWSAIRNDKELGAIAGLISHARELEVDVVTQSQAWRELKHQNDEKAGGNGDRQEQLEPEGSEARGKDDTQGPLGKKDRP